MTFYSVFIINDIVTHVYRAKGLFLWGEILFDRGCSRFGSIQAIQSFIDKQDLYWQIQVATNLSMDNVKGGVHHGAYQISNHPRN